LEDVEDAIQEYPGNVEWYLLRSQLQARLKLKKERISGLEQGIAETGGGVLEAEWVDALIDDKQHARAAEKIETELKNSRWHSSWLIRRARVYQATGKTEEAKSDLEEALTELSRRIHAAAPDPSLLADRALKPGTPRQEEEARKDYEQARNRA
jgi:tetratricopeptide (TPR) repeat protein